MPSIVRGIPILNLDGKKSVELESDYLLSILLRQIDDDDVDDGAVNLRPYDPANQDVTISPNGGGYSCTFRDKPGGTSLFAGAVAQNGVRAIGTLTFVGAPATTEEVVLVYPDMADPTVAPPIITRTYAFKTTPVAAYDLKASGVAATDLATLIRAINGTYDYGDPAIFFGTLPAKELVAVADPGDPLVMQLEARDGGVWGNNVGTTTDVTGASWAAALLSGGTGLRGVTLSIDHSLLPNSLITTAGISSAVTYDIMGLDSQSTADPTKLVAGAASLYSSNTVTT